MPEADLPILIAGAGCAGLSLAVELREKGYRGEVVLVDPRTEFGRDRTWCHFLTRPHAFESCIRHRWHHWCVKTSGRESVASSDRYPYVQVSSDDFYAKALSVVNATPSQRLCLGKGVRSIEPSDDSVRVVLSDRSVLRVAAVFDSRPSEAATGAAGPNITLYQQFVGLHVCCDKDVFAPDTADMMDFRIPQGDGIRFVYVLPYSGREALVEATSFAKDRVSQETLGTVVHQYLKAVHSTGQMKVVHGEHGCIPMTTSRPVARPHPRVIRTGLAGGAAKPSTGYAFGAIQRASATLAAELSSGVSPSRVSTPRHRRRRGTFLDDVFLSYLSNHPARAAGIFCDIFRNCPGDRIARFLTDTGSLADELSVIAAMPKIPFIVEAIRSVPIWSQPVEASGCPAPSQSRPHVPWPPRHGESRPRLH
jgi:lycopene beta-cyclase